MTLHLFSALCPPFLPSFVCCGSQSESITYIFLGAIVPLSKCSLPSFPETPAADHDREGRTDWWQIMWGIRSSSVWFSQTNSWKCNRSANCIPSPLPSAAAGPCLQRSAQALMLAGNSSVLRTSGPTLSMCLSLQASSLSLPLRPSPKLDNTLIYSLCTWILVAILVESIAALRLL